MVLYFYENLISVEQVIRLPIQDHFRRCTCLLKSGGIEYLCYIWVYVWKGGGCQTPGMIVVYWRDLESRNAKHFVWPVPCKLTLPPTETVRNVRNVNWCTLRLPKPVCVWEMGTWGCGTGCVPSLPDARKYWVCGRWIPEGVGQGAYLHYPTPGSIVCGGDGYLRVGQGTYLHYPTPESIVCVRDGYLRVWDRVPTFTTRRQEGLWYSVWDGYLRVLDRVRTFTTRRQKVLVDAAEAGVDGVEPLCYALKLTHEHLVF